MSVTCACVSVYRGAHGTPSDTGALFDCSPSYILRQSFSLNLQLTGLASQLAPGLQEDH